MKARKQNSNPYVGQLDPALAQRLSALSVLLRRCIAIEGVAWLVGFLVLAAVLQFALDAAASGLRWSMRAVLLATIIGVAAILTNRRLIGPLRNGFGLSEMANLIERKYPHLRSVLISAVRFADNDFGPAEANSPSLMRGVLDGARRAVETIDFAAIVNRRRATRCGWALVATAALVAIIGITAPTATALWLSRNVLLQNVPWPKRTHLVINGAVDGVITHARGDDVVIEAYADGVQPRDVELSYETAPGERGRETMVTVGSVGSYRYRHTFKNAEENLRFRLAGGDDVTEYFSLELIDRPRVVSSHITVTPPKYCGQEEYAISDGRRSVQVLRGTNLAFRVTLNKPVVKAELVGGSESVPVAKDAGDAYVAETLVMESGSYHFALTDDVGLENRRPVRFAVRAIRDQPPRVRMQLPGVGDMITPEAILPIEVSLEDEFGIATVDVNYEVLRQEAAQGTIELPSFAPGATDFLTTVNWPVANAGVLAGDRVTLLCAATDFDDVSGPNMAQSAEISLRIVARDELLAQLARFEQELRQNFERLLNAQEQLRGQLLTVRNEAQQVDGAAAIAASLGPLERRQRTLTSNVNVIRQQFEQILTQLRVNQLDTAEEMQRLGSHIIDPLTELVRRDLATAADLIRKWSRDASMETSLLADRQQVVAVDAMRAILKEMLQWEGYHEVVTMLRDIIKLQKDLSDESQDALLQEAEDIFDD